MLIKVNNENFKTEVSKGVCLVDFYADWCGPCKAIAPVLEELSKDYDGKIDIYKIDTEAERELSGMFGIQSIASLLFIRSEERRVGNASMLCTSR